MFLSHSFRFLSQNVWIFLFCENFAYFRDANWSEISRKKSENFAFFTSERNVKNAKFSARNATFSRNDFHFSMETLVRMRSFSQRKHSRVSILNTFAKRRKEEKKRWFCYCCALFLREKFALCVIIRKFEEKMLIKRFWLKVLTKKLDMYEITLFACNWNV